MGEEGASDGPLPLLLRPPPPPPPSLGPDGALLRVGLAEAEEDDGAVLPSAEVEELNALEDGEGVEIFAGLQSQTNMWFVSQTEQNNPFFSFSRVGRASQAPLPLNRLAEERALISPSARL